ncbi:MAG: hypothetical protein ACOCRX_08225 [Candidatus Woesearchaeota archaeon]
MKKDINITEEKSYLNKFDKKIYNKFKKIAKKNNKKFNLFLNLKIEELKDNIILKKYEENNKYKKKTIHLTEENHRFSKNMFYIHGITIRDYIQSLMEETIRREKEQPQK